MADEEIFPKPEPHDIKGVKYIYDSYFQESDNISHRTDWFLIFHAILFEALFAAKEHCYKLSEGITLPFNCVQLIINFLGIAISFYWCMTGIRTWKILWKFGSYMRNKDAVGENLAATHNLIYSNREVTKEKFYPWAKPSIVFLIVIPLLFTIAWILIYLLCFNFSLTWMYMTGASLFVISMNAYANHQDNKMKHKYGALKNHTDNSQ